MIIPIRCFTCGKVLSNKYYKYLNLIKQDYNTTDALSAIGVHRYCCKRMILANVDLIDNLLKYDMGNSPHTRNEDLI